MRILNKKGGFRKVFLFLLLTMIAIFFLLPVLGSQTVTTKESQESIENHCIKIQDIKGFSDSFEAQLLSEGHQRKLILQTFKDGKLQWEKDSPSELIIPSDSNIIIPGKQLEQGFFSHAKILFEDIHIYNKDGSLINKVETDIIRQIEVLPKDEIVILTALD